MRMTCARRYCTGGGPIGSLMSTRRTLARTLVCGYARIGGRAVGIVANQKLNQSMTVSMGPQQGQKRTEFGGVIYTESAQKAARFIMDCNQSLVPLIFLHDVNGFMVGKDAEWSATIIRAGAKMVLPGGVHLGGAEDHRDPRREFWSGALRYVRQGLRSAVSVCVADGAVCGDVVERPPRTRWPRCGRNRMERWSGEVVDEAKRKALHDEIKATYDAQADPRYGAARLWIDSIIDPAKTREVLMTALECLCAESGGGEV